MASLKIVAIYMAVLMTLYSCEWSKAEDSESLEDNETENRFFFGHFFGSGGSGERVSCDYNTQGGTSCRSCNQLLVCGRNGGQLKNCSGIFQHCTDGRCTFRQSDACAAAAAATTTESSNSTTTESSATTTQATDTTTAQ